MQDYLQLYERKTNVGTSYIAAKAGLLLKAVIFPQNRIDKQLVSELSHLTSYCKQILQEKHSDSYYEDKNEDQLSIFQKDIYEEGHS